jgi:hypothetical protein
MLYITLFDPLDVFDKIIRAREKSKNHILETLNFF